MSERAAASLLTASTSLCADSVESVPGYRGLFALATYQVDKHEQEQAQAGSSSSTANQPDATHVDKDEDEEEKAQASASTSPAYTRRGTCSLYSASSDSEAVNQVRCSKVDMIETPAILDMKWSLTRSSLSNDPRGDVRRVLGIANAKGQVTLHRLSHLTTEASSSKARLQSLGELRFNDRSALCLSLDFSDRRGGFAGGYNMSELASDTSLIVSQSDGSLAYLPSLELALGSVDSVDGVSDALQQASLEQTSGDAGSDAGSDDWDHTSEDERVAALEAAHLALNTTFASKPRGLTTWQAHDFEAWIAGFDCFTPTTVWSGGDDLSLKGWDLRSGGPTPSKAASPTFTCTKPFDGGVTSLQSHHLRQHLWAVGSYDSRVRLFDARMPARPLCETDVGGGVWRVKWHPSQPDKLLVACMHDGFKVLSLADLTQDDPQPAEIRGKEFEIVTRFDEHKSLAYGCDWDRATETEPEEGHKVYSCSFYDATMHIWDGLTS